MARAQQQAAPPPPNAQAQYNHYHFTHDASLRNRKSKFLTFVFSALPGLNYMYLGLMKRGLFFMSLFFALTIVVREIRIGMFSLSVFMLICFCLFDSFRIRRLLRDGFDVPDSIDDVASFYRSNRKPVLLLIGILIFFAVMRRGATFFMTTVMESYAFSAFFSVAISVLSFVLWLLAIVLVCYIIAKIVSRRNNSGE